MKHTKQTLRRVISYIRGRKKLLLLSLFLAAVSVAATLWIPILIGDAVNEMVGKGKVHLDLILQKLTLIGILTAISAAAQWLLSLSNNRLSFGIVHDMRRDAFSHLQKTRVSYLDTHKTGDLVNRVISDADVFADGLLLGMTQLFTGLATIIGTLVLMLSIHWVVAIAVVILTPLSLFVARFIATRTHAMFVLQTKIRGEETGYMNEIVTNQKVVKAFSRESASVAHFDEVNTRLEKASLRATFFSSLTNPSTRFVNSLVYAAVAVIGACIASRLFPFAAIALTVGQLTTLLSYANQYTKPFNEISGVVTELQNSLACADRLFDLCEAPVVTADPEDAAVLENASGLVEFRDVSFSYTPSRPLIRNVSLTARPGMQVAIVGPTGCGKTTLINLLMRFYDVESGAVMVEGQDIRRVTRRSLRESYGMVLQDSFVKNGTIRENIAMANKEATDEDIVAAAKMAHAHSFIRRLPNGYDTVVGDEGGAALSEGQKQLLAIARVMLSMPPILILDEATSSIDTRTELRVQDAFKKLTAGRTSFIVAHRLSTIKEADLILVMKDGNIIEKGTHDELLSAGGFYQTLYQSQFEG